MSVHTVVPALQTETSIGDFRKELFSTLDARAREIEASWKSLWVEFADLCSTVRDDELWRDGGYHSFGAWLQSACPTSRSYAYLLMGVRDELREIPAEELKQIAPGNARILRDVPKQDRPKVIEEAKVQPPREFTGTVIERVPQAHIEKRNVHRFRLTQGQSERLIETLNMWRVVNDDPEAPVEDVLEGILADYYQSHQHEFQCKSSGRKMKAPEPVQRYSPGAVSLVGEMD